jgi:actin-like ATPase involved in cell morphogenesis
MPYLKEYIEAGLGMPVMVADSPHFAVARGGGVALRDKKLLSRIELLLDE